MSSKLNCVNCGMLIDELLPDEIPGDSGTIGEELLVNIPENELKSKAVEISVKEGYFTLEEALAAYQLSLEDYKLSLKPTNT